MTTVNYLVRRSKRAKRLRIAVYCDGSVVVTQPVHISAFDVEGFIKRKLEWIQSKVSFFLSRKESRLTRYSKREYLKYKDEVLALVRERVTFFNQFYKLHFNKILIKNQRTMWGSCSRKKNLNFNYKMLFLPKEVQDYIVVHELCHLKEFNHSKRFWDLVRMKVPDFQAVNANIKDVIR